MADLGKATQPPVVELRVHGVGGTSPEVLLDHPRPDQIAGDDISGFYRRPDRDDLEAYSWGGITSRSGARAGWLLLLPFALANVAGWLLPHTPKKNPGSNARVQKAIVRLIALLITSAYVLWIGLVAVDVVAYQCGGQRACLETHWWMQPFDLEPLFGNPQDVLDADTGELILAADPFVSRRIAAGMLVPVAVVGLLMYLGKTSRNRYEEQFPEPTGAGDPEADPALQFGIADEPLWHSSPFVKRLTRMHIAVAFVAIAGAAADSLWRLEKALPGVGEWERVYFGLLVLSVALAAAVTVLVAVLAWVADWVETWLPRAAYALVALVFVVAAVRQGPSVTLPGELQPLPGWGRFSQGATLVLVALVVVLFLLSWRDAGRRRLAVEAKKAENPRLGFRGYGAFTAATFAWVVLAVVFAGTVVRIADWLGDRPPTEDQLADPNYAPPDVVVEYASSLDWLSVIVFLFLVGVALAVATRLFFLAFGRGNGWRLERRRREIDREYRDVTSDPRPATCRDADDEPCGGPQREKLLHEISRTRRIRSALGSADGIGADVAIFVVVSAIVVFVVRTMSADGDVVADLPRLWSPLRPLLGPATWLAAILPVLFVGFLRQAYRNPTTRRRVGILWDVITFWPRWFHPLSPPSYATRAIPQLTLRLRRLLATTKGTRQGVVLSTHSQGTIVGAATVLRVAKLQHGARERLAFLTHGSPLRRLYGRFFPGYFGTAGLAQVREVVTGADGLERWRNLYRLTDPIGGAVFGEAPFKKTEHGPPLDPTVDLLVADPITDRHGAGDPCPRIQGHSGYFSTPNSCSCPPYDEVLAAMKVDLAARVAAGAAASAPPTPTTG